VKKVGSPPLVSVFAPGRFENAPDLVVRSGTTYRVITDQLGSVRLVVDLNGNIQQRIDYDEYGNATVVTDTTGNVGNPPYILFQPFGFAGGTYDTVQLGWATVVHARLRVIL